MTDLVNDRTDMTQARQAEFQFAGALVQRQHQAQDGDVAVNYPPNGHRRGAPRRRHAIAAARRCTTRWPPCGRAGRGQPGPTRARRATTTWWTCGRTGDVIQLAVSRATKLPIRVSMLDAHPNLGDVVITTAFSDYEDVRGVKMPKRLTTTIDKYPQFDLRVSRNTVDVDSVRWRPPPP